MLWKILTRRDKPTILKEQVRLREGARMSMILQKELLYFLKR